MPETTDLTVLLDQLDAARAKATPGEWSSPEYMSTVYGGDPAQLLRVASSVHPADAGCIVAEHNATPRLIAAVRAVQQFADDTDRSADELDRVRAQRYDELPDDVDRVISDHVARNIAREWRKEASRLRTLLASALAEEEA